MEEIKMRTEVLMEMYQWLEKETQTLDNMDQLHRFYEKKVNKEEDLKKQVTA
jgi:transposase-like protein